MLSCVSVLPGVRAVVCSGIQCVVIGIRHRDLVVLWDVWCMPWSSSVCRELLGVALEVC